MTDAERRRLILLAEARGHANVAAAAIAKLVESLERVRQDHDADFSTVVRTTKDVWSRLLDISEHVDREIGKIP